MDGSEITVSEFRECTIYGRSGYPLVDSGRKYEEGICPKAEKDLKEMLVVQFNEGYTNKHIALIAKTLKKVFDYYRVK